jgi:hypothetical protein
MGIRGQCAGDVFHKRLANNEHELIITMKITLLGCVCKAVINILKQHTTLQLQGKSMLSVEKCCTDTLSLQSRRQKCSQNIMYSKIVSVGHEFTLMFRRNSVKLKNPKPSLVEFQLVRSGCTGKEARIALCRPTEKMAHGITKHTIGSSGWG